MLSVFLHIYILYIYIFTYTVAIHVFNRATEFIYPEARLYPPDVFKVACETCETGRSVRVINTTTADSSEISCCKMKVWERENGKSPWSWGKKINDCVRSSWGSYKSYREDSTTYIYIYKIYSRRPKAFSSPLDFSEGRRRRRRKKGVVARIIGEFAFSKRAISSVFAPFSQGPEFISPLLSILSITLPSYLVRAHTHPAFTSG